MSQRPSPPRGMRDLLPAEVALRHRLLTRILAVYGRYGFQQIETPIIEEIDRLSNSEAGENATLIYKILRRGLPDWPASETEAVDLGLRYDLTVPLARFFASHSNDLLLPFKSIQIGPVFRAERPQKGRYRQFTQCDIDIIGDASPAAEVDLVMATAEALQACDVGDFTVRINDRSVLESLVTGSGYDDNVLTPVLIALDKLDKLGTAGVHAELTKIDDGVATKKLMSVIEDFIDKRDFDDIVASLPHYVNDSGLDTLRAVARAVRDCASWINIELDVTLVRGMGYYTGSIFEIEHDEFKGSIGGGGRYDRMVGKLSGQDAPAVGFSIGFERLCHILENKLDGHGEGRRVALLHGVDVDLAVLTRAAAALRAGGDTVRREVAVKNRGAQLSRLTDAGFTHWAELNGDTMSGVQTLQQAKERS